MTSQQTEPLLTYTCPGERYSISRPVHLGRLASFYPKCRECVHRDDTGSLSNRTVRLLQRALDQRAPGSLFIDDGVEGVYLNALDYSVARSLGVALAQYLALAAPVDSASRRQNDVPAEAARLVRQRGIVVIVGCDERLSSPDLAAGAIEGLRRAGCQVVDVGCVTGACLRYAVRYLDAQGGVHIGGRAAAPHVNGMTFYGPSAIPLTQGRGLEQIQSAWQGGTTARSRRAGPLSHFQVDVPYVASLLKYFHALRPLHVVVDAASETLERYFDRLLTSTPCQVTWSSGRRRNTQRTAALRDADLGVLIDGHERIAFFDERHEPVAAQQTCLLLGSGALRIHPGATLVLAEGRSDQLDAALAGRGANVVTCPSGAANVWSAMNEHDATFGASGWNSAEPSAGSRFWFCDNGPVTDPLRALAAMLAALSLSDLPLSQILCDLE